MVLPKVDICDLMVSKNSWYPSGLLIRSTLLLPSSKMDLFEAEKLVFKFLVISYPI